MAGKVWFDCHSHQLFRKIIEKCHLLNNLETHYTTRPLLHQKGHRKCRWKNKERTKQNGSKVLFKFCPSGETNTHLSFFRWFLWASFSSSERFTLLSFCFAVSFWSSQYLSLLWKFPRGVFNKSFYFPRTNLCYSPGLSRAFSCFPSRASSLRLCFHTEILKT